MKRIDVAAIEATERDVIDVPGTETAPKDLLAKGGMP